MAPAEGPEKCGPRRPTRSGYSCNNAQFQLRGDSVPDDQVLELEAGHRLREDDRDREGTDDRFGGGAGDRHRRSRVVHGGQLRLDEPVEVRFVFVGVESLSRAYTLEIGSGCSDQARFAQSY